MKDASFSDFLKAVSLEKRKQQEEIDCLIGNSFDDLFLEQLKPYKTVEEIAKKHNVSVQKIKQQLKIGIKVEKEHTNNSKIASEIALQHLDEIPDYYDRLKRVEKKPIKEEANLIEKSLGLLSEPSDVKQGNDPLTPLDKKFATFEDLQKHYQLFLGRIQQQLSTLGGGGETRLEFLDDVDRNSVKQNNKYLKYDSNTQKWIGDDPLAVHQTYNTTLVTTSTYTITEDDDYIGVNYAGAVTIILPENISNGRIFRIKDERGEASQGTNRYITILPSGSDTIDGRDRAILAYDYGSLNFIYRNGWRIV